MRFAASDCAQATGVRTGRAEQSAGPDCPLAILRQGCDELIAEFQVFGELCAIPADKTGEGTYPKCAIAGGWPGIGLLLLRLVVGFTLVVRASANLWAGPPQDATIVLALLVACGILLILGLWTPIVGRSLLCLKPGRFWHYPKTPRSVCCWELWAALSQCLDPVCGRSMLAFLAGSASMLPAVHNKLSLSRDLPSYPTLLTQKRVLLAS